MAHHTGGETLSLVDFQDLLDVLDIKLPEDVLNEDVVRMSRSIDTDPNALLEHLKKNEFLFRNTPRLICTKVKQALNKMHDDPVKITEMIFFYKPKGKQNLNSLQKQCQVKMSKDVSRFRMKQTLTSSQVDDLAGGFSSNFNSRLKVKQMTEKDFLKFLSKCKNLMDSINRNGNSTYHCYKELNVDFGFLSGRVDFVVTGNGGSSKHIFECKSTEGDMLGKVFKIPGEGDRAELNKNHPYYYQTLTYKYILKNIPDLHQFKAQAVMELKQNEKSELYISNPKQEKQSDVNDDSDGIDEEEDSEQSDEDEDYSGATYTETHDPAEDRAVMVLKYNKNRRHSTFYWNDVEEVSNVENSPRATYEDIKALEKFCQEKALPQFLAFLNLLFEKKSPS